MKSTFLALLLLVAGAFVVPTILPVDEAQARITTVKRNKGGNEPQGEARGVPSVNVNPTGKAPPGQNK